MSHSPSASFWDGVRALADSIGLLVPQGAEGQQRPRPAVPPSVCDSCPICQAAATLDQVDPQVITEVFDVARGMLVGMGSALASAAEQRLAAEAPPTRKSGSSGESGESGESGSSGEVDEAGTPSGHET